MDTIRIVWGVGDGPTEMASYDAALADAGVHNYNLVTVSSMIPAGAEIEVADTAPYLGPPGNRLTVVQGRRPRPPASRSAPASAGCDQRRDRACSTRLRTASPPR